MMSRTLKTQRAAWTKAKRSNDLNKVQFEYHRTMKEFDYYGYPDCWQDWGRDLDDFRAKENT